MIDWFSNLNPIIQGLLATLFTSFITCLGSSLVFFFKEINKKILNIMMGVSSGIMIAAAFWSLLLPAIDLSINLGRSGYIETSLGFIFGGLFLLLSEIIVNKSNKAEGNKKTLLLTSAVTMHNIPEGMAVGVGFGTLFLGIEGVTIFTAMSLAFGIGIQNFPEGACVSLPCRASGKSPLKSFLIGSASGSVEIISGIVGVIFALTVQNILPFLLSFAAGAMIVVVAMEMIPDAFKENKLLASIGLIVGFIVMMVLDVALG